ncbi:MAG: oxalate:formate antiporter [Rubrobacteraceae bacterium]|nr:oxalate:formate antiporter [Rubrobacteraceae bacterium]
MSESESRGNGGQASSSTVLVVALWALVLIPLLWGVYQTLTAVVALFAA